MTIKQLAQQAIDMQDACNLSGIIRSWAEAISALRELCPNLGTRGINAHPINCLFASKVHDLCNMGLSDSGPFGKAYAECKRLAGEP